MAAKIKTEYFDRILSYIEEYINSNGRSPSIKEMETDLRIPHTTINRYLIRMQDAGLIEYNGFRNIRTREMMDNNYSMNKAPRYDLVACGEMDDPSSTPEEFVKLPSSIFGDSDLFLVSTIGTSMTNAGIDKNDILVCEVGRNPKRGDIVIAFFEEDNMTTCKFYDPDPNSDRVYFRASSPYSYDRDIESVKGQFVIQGIVVNIIKKTLPEMREVADFYITD